MGGVSFWRSPRSTAARPVQTMRRPRAQRLMLNLCRSPTPCPNSRRGHGSGSEIDQLNLGGIDRAFKKVAANACEALDRVRRQEAYNTLAFVARQALKIQHLTNTSCCRG